jgi:Flp pilus assembly protein TadG
MVEFAMTAGLFAVMITGILEFGFSTWAKNSAASDAKEGARYAMVHGGTSGSVATSQSVSDYVKSKTALGSSIRVYTAWENATQKSPGTWVRVTVAHDVPRRGPFVRQHTDSIASQMTIAY